MFPRAIYSFLLALLISSHARGNEREEIGKLQKEYETCIAGVIEGPDEKGVFYCRETKEIWARNRPKDESIWLALGTARTYKPGKKIICLLDYDKRGRRIVSFVNRDGTVKLGGRLVIKVERLQMIRKPKRNKR